MKFILIDLSYFVFYRYYALIKYWKLSNRELNECSSENQEFFEHFEKMFEKSFLEVVKTYYGRLKRNYQNEELSLSVIFAQDCPRGEIWRRDIHEEYKGNRQLTQQNSELISIIFDKVYRSILPNMLNKYKFVRICRSSNFEADDIISCIVNLLNSDPTFEMTSSVIITNDNDYLQLLDKVDNIYNMQGKSLRSKLRDDSVCKTLFYKICCGDTSDNIKGFISKQKLTALLNDTSVEAYTSLSELESQIYGKLTAIQQANYQKNKSIICFESIPEDLYEKMRADCYNQIGNNLSECCLRSSTVV